MSTDKDWEKWGAKDPYFGVFSDEKFRKNKLDKSSKSDFFASGEAHIDRMLELISKEFGQNLKLARTLDFGCGVGRLLMPLARRSVASVGVDISPSMIEEAKVNVSAADLNNVSFSISDDEFKNVSGYFSFVHSYIVFQHIPWVRGRFIIQQLASKVEEKGFLAIHFLTSTNHSVFARAFAHLRYNFPPVHFFWNLLKRRSFFEPPMQLHIYNLEKIKTDLKALGYGDFICSNEEDMDGFKNMYLFAQRKYFIPPA